MRILHTADWHLCDRLGRVNRTDDLKGRVEIVAALCEQHAVDVLLIAGDLFSDDARVSVEEMTEALTHLHQVFVPFFERGGTILAITGNHDREARIELIRHGMRLASPEAGTQQFRPGRLYLFNRPYFGTLRTCAGERAQFVLVPYPTSSRYAESSDEFRSKEEENRILHGRVVEEIRRASKHADFDAKLPTILAAHLHVRGAEVHSLYKIAERDDVVFDPSFLPTAWAYIALGHIHKPQCLGGMNHVRYPGSLDRLDLGERGDEKGVILVELGPAGLQADPVWLPIAATSMHHVVIADPARELAQLAERYPDRETAIVHLRVTHHPAGPSRGEITQELRRLFPRHTSDITWEKPDPASATANPRGFKPHADYRTTIRHFLAKNLASDPDREEILALAEKFLTAEAES